ncbi:MAG: SCO family protein [Saprospiraceae bacterium]|nr:SCO family protein [Saprospiraceae bacterium]
MRYNSIILLLVITFISSCKKEEGPLPILGQKLIEDGKEIYHTIPQFELVNQDSMVVNNELLKDNIYLVDYFFTHCPSICPIVKKNLLTVHEEYKDEPLLKMVSISMDPKRDSVNVLKTYASNLGINQDQWWFLTGDKDEIMDLAPSFFIVAYEDQSVPGGFDHSGKVVLVDKNGNVRAFAEGTDADDVKKLIPKIQRLIDEYKG